MHVHLPPPSGCYEACAALLTRGAALHAPDLEVRRPACVRAGCEPCVRDAMNRKQPGLTHTLLSRTFLPYPLLVPQSCWTPLHTAFYHLQWKVALLLLRAGAYLGDGDEAPPPQQRHKQHGDGQGQWQWQGQGQQYPYNLFQWPCKHKPGSSSSSSSDRSGSTAAAREGARGRENAVSHAYTDHDGMTPFALLSARLVDVNAAAAAGTGSKKHKSCRKTKTQAQPQQQKQQQQQQQQRWAAAAGATSVHVFGKADFMLGIALPNRYVVYQPTVRCACREICMCE